MRTLSKVVLLSLASVLLCFVPVVMAAKHALVTDLPFKEALRWEWGTWTMAFKGEILAAIGKSNGKA